MQVIFGTDGRDDRYLVGNDFGSMSLFGGDDFGYAAHNGVAIVDGGYGNDHVSAVNNGLAFVMPGYGNDYVYASGNDQVSVWDPDFVSATFVGNGAAYLESYGYGSTHVGAYGNGYVQLHLGSGDNMLSLFDNGYAFASTGSGNDTIYAGGAHGFAHVTAGWGDDRYHGSGAMASQVDLGDGDDVAQGGVGQDVFFGGDGRDVLSGGAGEDLLFGGGGNDALFGDEGADFLSGGTGDDLLVFGHHDTLYGGWGSDRFAFDPRLGATGSAMIADFNPWAGDTLDLSHTGLGRDALFSGPDGSLYLHGGGYDFAIHGVGIDAANPAIIVANSWGGKG